jgi:hypothetical protein
MLDFICFSINNWEKRKARKQQFMLHLSLRRDVGKILYVEPPLNLLRLLFLPSLELKTQDNRKRWLRALSFKIESPPESKKLFIFTPLFFIPFSFRSRLIYNLNLYISLLIIKSKISRLNFENTVLWLYHPFDYKLLKWFKKRSLAIFDWAEDWAEYFIEFSHPRRRHVSYLEKKMVKDVDIVFVVSKKLLERAKNINDNSYQILDGTMPEIFANYDRRIPLEIKNIVHPMLGYVGTIFKRLDLDLIAELSEKLPRCSIVLIGNILLPSEELINIRRNNVFLLGGRKYEELPNYMMNFDVCILPYIPVLDTSPPTKIYDYLATGKPIVSTYLPALEDFGNLIKLAHTKEEFIRLAREAVNEDDAQIQNRRLQKAKESSWSFRAEEIMNIITEVSLEKKS